MSFERFFCCINFFVIRPQLPTAGCLSWRRLHGSFLQRSNHVLGGFDIFSGLFKREYVRNFRLQNWDLSQYLEREQSQFIKNSHQQLLVETVRGQGPHLAALARLMECPQSSSKVFAGMLWEHRQQTVQLFETAKQTPEFMIELSKWIKADPELRNTCGMS